MKIGIIGSRNFTDESLIHSSLDKVVGRLEENATMLTFLGGGSKGAERIAAEYLTSPSMGFDYVLFKPYSFIDTKVPHDPKYFYFRNKQIVDNSDMVLVFDDGQERNVAKTVYYLQHATTKAFIVFQLDGGNVERLGPNGLDGD